MGSRELLQSLRFLVSRCKFYYYLGMARPTEDQEKTALEKIVILTIQEKGHTHFLNRGPCGEASRSVSKQKEEGKTWARAFTVVSMGRNGKTG